MGKKNTKLSMIFKIGVALDLILLLAIGLFVRFNNKYDIEFNVDDGTVVSINYAEDINMYKVEAIYKGNILLSEGVAADIVEYGIVDTNKIGKYDVTYTDTYENIFKTITFS